MRLLSVRQPWASLIISGIKRVELRAYPTPYRGDVLIHAARNVDDDIAKKAGLIAAHLPRGGVIGMVSIVDCVEADEGAFCAYAWVLDNPHPLPFVEHRAHPGLYQPTPELLMRLELPRR